MCQQRLQHIQGVTLCSQFNWTKQGSDVLFRYLEEGRDQNHY